LIIQDEVAVDTTIGIDQTTAAALVGVEAVVVAEATPMLLPTTITDSSNTDEAAAAAEDTATISQTGILLLFHCPIYFRLSSIVMRGPAHF
jgi:hypothetical protein